MVCYICGCPQASRETIRHVKKSLRKWERSNRALTTFMLTMAIGVILIGIRSYCRDKEIEEKVEELKRMKGE